MSDTLHRVIATHENIFGVCCDCTQLVAEACRRHDVGPTAGAALGRALAGSILLSALMKDGQSVSLKFEGNGPLRKVITEAGYDGWSRGYVAEPRVDLPLKNGNIDVCGGIGRAGLLTVTKDIGMKEKYQGTVQLYTSEIGEDIAFYLTESEQTPSAVSLGVRFEPDGTVSAAGGFIVQTLPPANDELIAELEKQIINQPTVTSQLLSGKTPDLILGELFGSIAHKSSGQTALTYQCSCSKEKMASALMSLGKDEIDQILTMENGITVNCEFCRDSYTFEKEEIGGLFTSANQPVN